MSPLWRDEVGAYLSPHRLCLVRMKRGTKPAPAAEHEQRFEGAKNDSWSAALEAFKLMLSQEPWSRARIRVVLADHWARYAIVPWVAALNSAQAVAATVTAELEAERKHHAATRGRLDTSSTELVTVKARAEAQAGVQLEQVERLKRVEAELTAARGAAAAAREEAAQLRGQAHDLVSTAGGIGARHLSALARRLESACLAGRGDEAAALATTIGDAAPGAYDAVREHLSLASA